MKSSTHIQILTLGPKGTRFPIKRYYFLRFADAHQNALMLDVQGSPDLSKGPDKQPSDSDPWKFASNWILKVPLKYCNPSIMSRNLAFYCDDFSNIYFRLDI